MSVLSLVHDALIYSGIGAFAGITAGALGIGGGLVVVPGLLFIFQSHFFIPPSASMHVAAGTSLAIMVLTSVSSISAHLKRGQQFSSFFKKLWPGLLLGTIFGVLISQKISTYGLKLVFAVFLLVVAIKMYMDLHVKHASKLPSKWMNGLVNFIIGVQSGLLGIGGGILTIPYLTYCGLDIRKIAAISNLCTLMVALVGTIMFMITGFSFMRDTPYATGYIYWPAVLFIAIPSMMFAPLGADLSYKLPQHQLRFCFIIILIVTAISLLV